MILGYVRLVEPSRHIYEEAGQDHGDQYKEHDSEYAYSPHDSPQQGFTPA